MGESRVPKYGELLKGEDVTSSPFKNILLKLSKSIEQDKETIF